MIDFKLYVHAYDGGPLIHTFDSCNELERWWEHWGGGSLVIRAIEFESDGTVVGSGEKHWGLQRWIDEKMGNEHLRQRWMEILDR